jgi:hypothetical protein
LIAAAEITPSGVPPMPQSRSIGVSSLTAASEADTSPCGISLMRAPAARISAIASSWRGLSSMITTRSPTPVPFSFAISSSVSPSGRSRSRMSA